MFEAIQQPGRTEIRFNGQAVLSFIDEHVILRHALIADARMRPDGPVELATMLTSCFFGPNVLRNAVDCDVRTPHRITVTIRPEKVDGGLQQLVQESRRITIDYDKSHHRFRYRIDVELDFLHDIRGGEGLRMTPMKVWDGRRCAVVEFDDPLLAGGIGPQVPMTQDWTGLPEPLFGEPQFTKAWTKRYLSVLLESAERGHRRLAFNRTTNSVSQFYNRHILEGAPGAPYYYKRTDGRYLRMTPLFTYRTGHHICEWGYDMHWYAMLPPADDHRLFRKGQHIALSYQIEDVEMDRVPVEFLNADSAELGNAERDLADRPIYQEPVCRFTDSTLDSPDSYRWHPVGNWTWDRSGGRAPNTGALVLMQPDANQRECMWTFEYLGPSYAANPIPPSSRFRIGAWIKADEPHQVQLRFVTNTHAGPAMFSTRDPVVTEGMLADDAARDGDWHRIEFVSQPSGPYTLTGSIVFAYAGKGTAALSELSVVRL